MKKIILCLLLVCSHAYSQEAVNKLMPDKLVQVPLKTINVDVENIQAKDTLSATGQYLFNYNQKIALILATELKDSRKNVNLLGMQGKETIMAKVETSNNSQPDFLISLGFGVLPPQELKFWEYNGQKVSYSDEVKGFSLFLNANHPLFRPIVLCAREISITLQKVGFQPNWAYNKNNKLIFKDQPIYQEDKNILLNESNAPVLRIEPGVLTHRKESQWFENENVDIAFAKAVSIGLNKCMN